MGPRDGLQNIKNNIPTEVKIAFVDALSQAGLDEIEVSSFVSPKRVPQLADAAEVFAGITRNPKVRYMALVPNEKGLDGAIGAKADKIAVFTAASETFNQMNINATIAESVERFRPVVERSPVPVRGYVSTAFYCPYEGKVTPTYVVEVIKKLLELGCDEISIGDTIGKAQPDEVSELLAESLKVCPPKKTAMHFHDTFGQAVNNAKAAAKLGITVFDASAGGIGGCPFAPGAPGNISTEALARTFDSGLDLNALAKASSIMRPYL
ncbi:MAG: hydroxymethylglutaryl-CoA lyase [Armatimonadetes bacterium]|nr:hydroxymethylglutaryl-CoA lyase [Armatimonadota bacterium]